MNVIVLSGGTGWHVQDLLRAAAELGHAARAVDFRYLFAGATTSLDDGDAVIVRTMPAGSLEQIVFRMDCLQQAAQAGVTIWNPPKALETCVDKYLTDVRLRSAGLPIPRTVACQRTDDAMLAFDQLGRDVVVKPLFGSEGRGLVRVQDPDVAWRIFHAIEQTGGILYIQEFVRHPGWDVRAFVIRDRILAAMQRRSQTDWRTNVARGGETVPFALNAEAADLACRAAHATGAVYAGVDLIQNHLGEWRVLEVNAVPGWRALAATCQIDVARAVLLALQEERT